jgi:hypothetical protein
MLCWSVLGSVGGRTLLLQGALRPRSIGAHQGLCSSTCSRPSSHTYVPDSRPGCWHHSSHLPVGTTSYPTAMDIRLGRLLLKAWLSGHSLQCTSVYSTVRCTGLRQDTASPLLTLASAQRQLHIPCGTGQWASCCLPSCEHKHTTLCAAVYVCISTAAWSKPQ